MTAARLPPALSPPMASRAGSSFNAAALACTQRVAAKQSSTAPGNRVSGARRYSTDKHAMPAPDDEMRKVLLDYLEKAFPPEAPKQGGGWISPFAPQK